MSGIGIDGLAEEIPAEAAGVRRLSVLRCIATVNPAAGGIIEAVLQSSKELEELGIDVEVASLDHAADAWARLFPFPLQALGSGRGGYGFSPHFSSWVRENAARYRAIIVEGIWQYHSFGTWWALRRENTPFYVFPHGMLDPWFRQAYPAKHLKKTIYWRLAESFVFRDSQAAIFTCEEERQLARGSFRPYRCREAVINLGTADPPGDPAHQKNRFFEEFPKLRGKRLLLFLGRLHEKKGCDLLLNAFTEFLRDQPTPPAMPWHLLIAGPCAESKYLQFLKDLADDCRLSPERGSAVSFIGMISGDLKWGAYHAADAFVLPSHQENFGMAVVEALACGLPVLISNKVNIWKEVAVAKAGLIEADDKEGVGRLVRGWAAMSSSNKDLMRVAARNCFRSRFDIRRTGSQLNDLIRGLHSIPTVAAHEVQF